MSSSSTDNGDSIIQLTFEVGFDQDIALLEALTRSDQALAQLPPEVNKVGLTIEKFSTNLLVGINLTSPNGTWDGRFLQNYAFIHIADSLARIPGVAKVNKMGLSKYALRIWLDPDKLTNLGFTPTDVVDAINEQNQQAAVGKIGQPPSPRGQAFQFTLTALGRLENTAQFENIILRANPDASVVRIKDVARVELGAEVYDWVAKFNGKEAAFLVISQLANANGLRIKAAAVEIMNRLAKNFPEDMTWAIQYDPTVFIEESTREVIVTIFEALALVILVVFIFLQSWRATLIPAIAVPVSLVGAFAFMLMFGFSINMLTLLGLVLAVALVVDDAIVVVETVQLKLDEGAGDPKEVTQQAIAKVRGPIIATTLVLVAVFVPVSFVPGMTGLLYNQFAITIAIAVVLSSIIALTLSPALCAIMLRPEPTTRNVFFRIFNRGYEGLEKGYAAGVKIACNIRYLVLVVFVGLCALAVYVFFVIPKGFLPEEDQGYVIALVQLPQGASVERTEAVMAEVTRIALETPGVARTMEVSGYNNMDKLKQPYAGFAMVVLDPFDERTSKDLQVGPILKRLRTKLATIPDGMVMVRNAPAVPGLGATGGFAFQIQDISSQGIEALSVVAKNFIAAARQRPELAGIFTTYNGEVPKRFIDIDRTKVKTNQVSITELFDSLQIYLGSLYVNEFNKFGRVFRVYVQAEEDARDEISDIGRLRVRNRNGEMIPLDALVSIKPVVGPYNIPHYNSYRSIAIAGRPAPSYSSGDAITAMEELAETALPEGFGFEWTGVVYQQQKAGNLLPLAFGLALVFAFLVLAALYESWALPFTILLSTPLGLLGAIGALHLRGMELDVYGQIALVMLIGLVAKNAILVVEFAKELREQGTDIIEAATTAARLRLRPVLMTSISFIIGLLPLMFATGPGSVSRQSIGTAVVGGLAFATITIVFVPVFFVIIERLRDGRGGRMTQRLANDRTGA